MPEAANLHWPTSIDQYLTGTVPSGEPALTAIAFRPMDGGERAAIFRAVETSARVPMPRIGMARRRETFDEVETGLCDADALREARRCLACGCRRADCCELRVLATEYDADPYRFVGARRRFSRDDSHPAIVYEPGKCIMCDACAPHRRGCRRAARPRHRRPRLRGQCRGAVRRATVEGTRRVRGGVRSHLPDRCPRAEGRRALLRFGKPIMRHLIGRRRPRPADGAPDFQHLTAATPGRTPSAGRARLMREARHV